MTTNPEALLLPAWKKQLEASLCAMETIVEGSIRIRQLQLEAATDAHADIQATRQAVAAATDATQLIKLQSEWLQSNARKSLAYWRSAYEALVETDAALVQRAYAETALPVPEAFKAGNLEASKQALLGIVDGAYRQWLDAAQRFYRSSEKTPA